MKETRVVKNKDIPQLQQISWLKQDVEDAEEQIAWIRERMFKITATISVTGDIRGSGGTGLDGQFAHLEELEKRYAEKLRIYNREIRKVQRIISGIQNEQMRTFVNLMYVRNMEQAEVRERMGLSEWGFRRARECVENAERMSLVVWREKYVNESEE